MNKQQLLLEARDSTLALLNMMASMKSEFSSLLHEEPFHVVERLCGERHDKIHEKAECAEKWLNLCWTELEMANRNFRLNDNLERDFTLAHNIVIHTAKILCDILQQCKESAYSRETLENQQIVVVDQAVDFVRIFPDSFLDDIFSVCHRIGSRYEDIVKFEYERAVFHESNTDLNIQELDEDIQRLSEKDVCILVAIAKLRNQSGDDWVPGGKIAGEVEGDLRASQDVIKDEAVALKKAGFILSKQGRGGGYQLTGKGKKAVEICNEKD